MNGRLVQKICTAFLGLMIAGGTLAQADPAHWKREGWITDFSRSIIDYDQVISGGPPKDGIPSYDDPTFKPASQDATIAGLEPVVALEIDGKARAYPIRYMMSHEIVNDTFGSIPIAVTYCPLCNTSIVFVRQIESETVEFGTTGKLRNSDLIMYDRGGSETWWQQFSGKAIAGLHVGKKLTRIPSRLMSYALYRETYPEGDVLQPSAKLKRQWGRNPYVGYDSAKRPFLFVGELPRDINPMVRVVVVGEGDDAQAVSLPYLRENTPVKLGEIEVRWQPGQASALDKEQIAQGRDVGNVDVVKIEGETESPVAHEVTFAFSAHAFLPDIEILK